jgi:hypothetical protein
MADDADDAERPVRPVAAATTHARTDRQSVETTPESLYLWRIAVLEARVDTLEERVDHKEQDLQHVIDRYETVLDGRHARDGELCTDGGPSVNTDPETSDRSHVRAVLDRVRSLLE